MGFTTFITLALATGFAASKPINSPQSLPAYVAKRQSSNPAFANGLNGQGFNFIDGFNAFNNQEQVIQVQEQNLQIVNNGFQQAIMQQVNQVLVVQNQQDGFNRDLNNLFRKSNFRRERNNEATVMLVVQQIQVSVADDRGNAFQQEVFVQSALVANRGARTTNTVMLFESKAVIATQLLGNNRNGFNGVGGFNGVAGATNIGGILPTKTAGIQLLGERPTWSAVVDDPAATLGAVWQAELEDLQRVEQDQADNKVNEEAAAKEREALDAAKGEEEKKAEEQKAQEEQKKQEEEQKKQDEEQKKQEEQKAQEEQKKAEDEKKKQEEEQKKQEEQKAQEEQKKQEEEQKKQAEEQKKQEEQKQQAEEQKKQEEQQGAQAEAAPAAKS